MTVFKRLHFDRSLSQRFTAPRTILLATLAIVLAQLTAYALIHASREQRTRFDAHAAALADLSRALSNAEDALHNVAGVRHDGKAIAQFYTSLRDVEMIVPRLRIDQRSYALDPGIHGEIQTLVQGWRRTVAAYETHDDARAVGILTLPAAERAMEEVQASVGRAIDRSRADAAAASQRIWTIFNLLFWFQIASVILLALAIGRSYRRVIAESRGRLDAMTSEAATRRRLELLFGMHDMLQAAEDHRDANLILSATASQLAPSVLGALYVFNNSGDRLHLSTQWGDARADQLLPMTITPNECWALKRGKPHVNGDGDQSLRCMHAHHGASASIEVPMIARGNILGMLVMVAPEGESADTGELRLVATALADGMSLALSNIALRERLRTQALRDGLTGLYNRRYMEDALERLFDGNGPAAPASSIIMIDLDHFKSINDEHGHAVGDNILRDVGPLLLVGLRKTDVACRYGGEELVVVLPNCDHDHAVARAEVIRSRIAELSSAYNFPISASLGVATSERHGRTIPALMAAADAALYDAKSAGRNRVMSADRARDAMADIPLAAE
ncbi:sensor domain-containing diguanylate cyclase [Sphingomonas sp. NIC1]|uniref:sensor domain-containing diguanylate cyclase n=1 Tax=Sphingomonas sp. NIC1 TaxID=1961362 RepID=UPI000A6F1D5A|nr:sensor domain-containing diguanylate cyclase [Sphingomonas sp. NIC1]